MTQKMQEEEAKQEKKVSKMSRRLKLHGTQGMTTTWLPCFACRLKTNSRFLPPFHDVHTHTVRNIHFMYKNSTLIFREKLSNTRENAAVLDFLAVDNFDFTRKIVKIFD